MSVLLNTKKTARSNKNSESASNYNEERINKVKSQQNLLDITMDQTRIQQQLVREIELAKEAIQKYYSQIQVRSPPKTAPSNRQECIASLIQMQKLIEVKNVQINSINQQIKMLKSSPDQACKDAIKKYKTIKNLQLFKLADQISQQKEDLLLIQKQHQKKKKQLEINKKIMKQAQQSCQSMKSLNNKKVISYQQFVNNKKEKEEKDRQDQNQKSKKVFKRHLQSAKQLTNTDEYRKKNILLSNNLKDVQSKRDVAQSALKILKRKHQTEINQLNSKLEFLRDENEELDIKLKQKVQQLKSAQIRFSQTKQIDTQKKIKVQRYSQPQF